MVSSRTVATVWPFFGPSDSTTPPTRVTNHDVGPSQRAQIAPMCSQKREKWFFTLVAFHVLRSPFLVLQSCLLPYALMSFQNFPASLLCLPLSTPPVFQSLLGPDRIPSLLPNAVSISCYQPPPRGGLNFYFFGRPRKLSGAHSCPMLPACPTKPRAVSSGGLSLLH